MLPKDPNMLLSVVNTLLRDHYSSVEELCDDRDEDPEELKNRLARAGYIYDPATNRFVVKNAD